MWEEKWREMQIFIVVSYYIAYYASFLFVLPADSFVPLYIRIRLARKPANPSITAGRRVG